MSGGKLKKLCSVGGFTLVEVLIAVIFIGLAIASLLAANRVTTQANGAAANLSRAEFLAEEIRELMAGLQYDDLNDFDGASFSPPIGADRSALNDLAAYSQQITVENVNASDFEQVVSDHGSNFVRVTVKVSLNSNEISSASWLRARF